MLYKGWCVQLNILMWGKQIAAEQYMDCYLINLKSFFYQITREDPTLFKR